MTNTDRELPAALIENAREAVDCLRDESFDDVGSPDGMVYQNGARAADNLDRAILNFELKSSLIREIPVE